MEIHARHTLIGLFTLAVICLGFGFVYWLNTTGGLGQRSLYRIRYDGPVSGLLKGSAVLFNGVRVGEVTALQLDAAAPGDVTVDIAVERRAPVRADTRVGIEFQGLTGAPVVSLAGGTSTMPLLNATPGGPYLLTAEKDAGQAITQVARDALRRIDAVITDNAAPLHSTIANFDKFSGALARNSDRLDGIVAGLERLTGGGSKPAPRIYDLAAAQTFPGLKKRPASQLLVPEPSALSMFDNEKILVRQAPAGDAPSAPVETGNWPDMLPKVVQSRLVQSFENAQYMGALGRVPDGTRADFTLLTDIRSFQVTVGPSAVAEVELAARITNADGKVVDARRFRADVKLETVGPAQSAKALSDAFEKIAAELVVWACATI